MADSLVLIANAGDATIGAFRLDADRLVPLATNPLPGACSTFAVDAARNLVYAAVKADVPLIVTLSLDPATGILSVVRRAVSPVSLAYLELTPDGQLLLGASYHEGRGLVWPVADGFLGEPTAEISHANLHCVKASGDGAFAYWVSLGDDLVAQCALSAGGVLTPLDPPTVAASAGSGPRHLVLSADQRSAYLVTEFSGEVVHLSRDADGRLTPAGSVAIFDPDAGLTHSRYGADPRAEHLIWGADVNLAGRVLVASERTAGTLASVELDADGRLGPVVALRPTEPQPRGFGVAPDPYRVIVVGERSTTATLYAVGPDGVLDELDRVENGHGANWVRVVQRA